MINEMSPFILFIYLKRTRSFLRECIFLSKLEIGDVNILGFVRAERPLLL